MFGGFYIEVFAVLKVARFDKLLPKWSGKKVLIFLKANEHIAIFRKRLGTDSNLELITYRLGTGEGAIEI